MFVGSGRVFGSMFLFHFSFYAFVSSLMLKPGSQQWSLYLQESTEAIRCNVGLGSSSVQHKTSTNEVKRCLPVKMGSPLSAAS